MKAKHLLNIRPIPVLVMFNYGLMGLISVMTMTMMPLVQMLVLL